MPKHHQPLSPETTSTGFSWKTGILALGLVLLTTTFVQAWFLGLSRENIVVKQSSGAYEQEYVRALAAGQSYLHIAPDPRVLAAPDPLSSPYLLGDVSLYHGRYYLYFGVVPFVTVLTPWYLLTKTFLPAATSILLFNVLCYAAYGAMLLVAAKRWKTKRSPLVLGTIFAGLVAGGGTWQALGRPAIYEIENAAAAAFFGWALFFLWVENSFSKPRVALTLAAGLAGLAFGCRPNYFPAIAVLSLYIMWRSWPGPGGGTARLIKAGLPLWPLVAVCIGLAAYNQHRFGSPWDFGVKNFPATNRESGLLVTSLRYVPYNAQRYLAGLANLDRYFPFVQSEAPGPFPLAVAQRPTNQVYGFLLFVPMLLWVALPLVSSRVQISTREKLLVGVAALAGLGNLCYLLVIGFGAYRYLIDVLNPLAFLACLGVIALNAVASGWRRCALGAALGGTTVATILAAFFHTVSIAQVHSNFDLKRPADFQRCAQPFNAAVYAWERVTGAGPTRLRLKLKFPANKFGQSEPLLVSGIPGLQDFLYVHYAGSGTIVLGFESIGRGGPVTGPIPLDYSVPHDLDILLGSFLPPADHPLLKRLNAFEVSRARSTVRIALDGKVRIDSAVELHPARARIFLGRSPDDEAFGSAFTGVIAEVTKPLLTEVDVRPRWAQSDFGPIQLSLKLKPQPTRTLEPVLSVGYRPTGGVLALEYLPNEQVRFQWICVGHEQITSSPVALAPNSVRKIEVSLGSLFPPAASRLWPDDTRSRITERKGTVSVLVDGQRVLDFRIATPEISPAEIAIAQNQFGMSGVTERLSGELVSVNRQAW